MAEKYLNYEGFKKLCLWIRNKFCDLTKFNKHNSDGVRHITAAERTDWNGKAAGNHTHSAATQSAAGLMSAADKSKLDGLSTYAKGIRGYTFLSDLKAGKYLKVLSVQLGDYRYYKYFTALLALNSFFASTSGLDKTKLDMIVSLDARQSSTNLDNIEFYAYSNAVPAMFNTERFIAAYKRVNTTDALFEVYIRLVYDYEYFSANVINSYTLPASPIDFHMALVDEIPSDMITSTLYVNKTYINAPSATAEKAGLMSAADKTKLDGITGEKLTIHKITLYKKDTALSTDKTAIGYIHIVMSNEQYINMYVTFNKTITLNTENRLVSDSFSMVKITKDFSGFSLSNLIGSFSGAIKKETIVNPNEIIN